MQKKYVGLLVAAIVVVSILTMIGVAFAWNFTVPAMEVKPVNGVFTFPVSTFEDGKARYFEYKHSPSEDSAFFCGQEH